MSQHLTVPVSERLIKFNSLFGIADIGVHVVHPSCVIIAYTLESLPYSTRLSAGIMTPTKIYMFSMTFLWLLAISITLFWTRLCFVKYGQLYLEKSHSSLSVNGIQKWVNKVTLPDNCIVNLTCNKGNKIQQGKSEGFESCDRPIVRKRPIWVKIGDVLSRVTLKFDGWPWKTIGHLSFAVSSFVQHFVAIGEFKLELLSGNAQFGSNSTIFRAMWPWNLTYDLEKQYGTSTMLLQALCIIS